MKKRMDKKKNRNFLVLTSLIFAVFFSFYVYYSRQAPIAYWDESDWVGKSYFFELLVKGDWDSSLWTGHYGYDQPKLTEYFFGAAIFPKYLESQKTKKQNYITFLFDHNLHSAGGASFYHLNRESEFDFIDWSYERGARRQSDFLIAVYGQEFKKTIDLIITARTANALALAGAALVVYFIALKLSSQKVAFLTLILWGFNSLILRDGLQAQPEALFLLTFNSGLLLLLLIFSKKKSSFISYVFFAVIVGLCMATKLNGVMLAMFFSIFIFLEVLADFYMGRRFDSMNGVKFIFVNFLAFLVFISLNPFVYKNPIRNTLTMFQHRQDVARAQAEDKNLVFLTFGERIKTNYTIFFDKESFRFCNTIELFKKKSDVIWFITLVSFLFGVGLTFYRIFRDKQKRKIQFLFLTLFALTQIIMASYLLVHWHGKYYIQLIIFLVFFQAVGFFAIIEFVHNKFFKAKKNSSVFHWLMKLPFQK